ncbi:cell adhesion molecule CEACAM5 [Aplochiton taeniatus]
MTNVDGVIGKNVTFNPTVTDSYITLSWTFTSEGGGPVPIVALAPGVENLDPGYAGRVILNKTTGALTLGPLTAKDSGHYTVSIVGKDAKLITSESKLRVLDQVSDITIKSNLTEAVELNSTVVLTCSAKGSFLKYAWLNGTVPIAADGTRPTLNADSTVLTLVGVLRTDLVGPIYCTASNALESGKSRAFNLSVSYGPENIDMKVTPLKPVYLKGENVSLSCSAQSSPAAIINWYLNGVALTQTGPSLVLSDVQEKHGGNYTCVANNAKTLRYVSSSVAKVTVLEAISGTKITGPNVTLIAGNQTVNLSCQATAGRSSSQVWLKNGQPLLPSSNVVISPDMSSVKLEPVTKGDSGEYVCTLSNAVSSESAKYNMKVYYGPEAATVTGKKAVEVKDEVRLKCSAASEPAATFTWKFNGTLTPVTTDEYTIVEAMDKNTGVYTCEARNAITGLSMVANHQLSVKEEGTLDEGLSDGAIAGIVIGVLIAVAALVGAVIYMRRKKPVESPY